MSDSPLPTFEQLLRQAQQTAVPPHDNLRHVQWCDAGQTLAISRQSGGGIELFLLGEALSPASTIVRRHLKYDHWTRDGHTLFQANRLVFPSEPHYVAVAAFLAEELIRAGITSSPRRAFAQSEPVIEMALRRSALSDEEVLGLLGELRFLNVLLSVATANSHAVVLDSWRGHERSSRDFVFGRRAVEVKATQQSRSVHSVSGVSQVDPGRSDSGEVREELQLLSLGFAPLDSDEAVNGLCVPALVDEILDRLADDGHPSTAGDLQTLFLAKVADYGGRGEFGYHHEQMRTWRAYNARWEHRFLRIYDMGDPEIKVLRRSDLLPRRHVRMDSVTFEIDLPDVVAGDRNPQTDPFALARLLLR